MTDKASIRMDRWISAFVATLLLSMGGLGTTQAEAASPSCTHGTSLLHVDAQAWQSLHFQAARLHKNLTAIRTEINDVIEINEDIGQADKTAKDIHKVLSQISPIMELAPTVQSGMNKTARAAEISHKDVLGPIHKVTNELVTRAKLKEIREELDTKVLPKISKLDKNAVDAHLRAVTLSKDYVEACHLAATIQKKACISAGEKAIDGVYAVFHKPVQTANTAVTDAAKAINVLNRILETEISVGLKPIIAIKRPITGIAKVLRAIERDIRKLEHAMKKHIRIHIGPINVRFTVHHLLKEWKIEMRKLEHLLNIDKIKRAMRRAVEKVLHSIVHAMMKFIHRLEHSIKIDGFNMGSLDIAFGKLRTGLNFKPIDFHLRTFDLAIKDVSLGLHGLKICK